MRKAFAVLALTTLAPATLVACADKVDEANTTAFTVAANDTECKVSGAETVTGTSSFEITNSGKKINEFYVYTSGGRVIGEVENIGPGATRKLTVQINDPGEYTMTCKPGMVGDGISSALKVTGEKKSATGGDQVLADATAGYLSYVRSQVTALSEQTREFAAAIESRDLDKAKALYPIARTYYERIEPVAESFPNDLDPRIDLREADLEAGDTWSGWHKIEKQLWQDGAITDVTIADAQQLQADIEELNAGVNAADYEITPVQIASGAQGLLDEIATSKITGEEDIFSHTDLYDFQANLDGSKAAIASLEEALKSRDADLLSQINAQFAVVNELLAKYRTADGSGFVSYDTVTEAQRKELSDALDVLTSKVAVVQEVIAK